MAVNLKKGGIVDLTKSRPNLKSVIAGLGWDSSGYRGAGSFDLDVSAYLLGANGKVAKDSDFIFYNNLKDDSGAVTHLGDNRDGEGDDGDDEQIQIDLLAIPTSVDAIVFVVTIHEGKEKSQNFTHIGNAYIRVVNAETDDEIAKYELDRTEESISCVFGQLVRNGSHWDFKAVGQGFDLELFDICKKFGVNV